MAFLGALGPALTAIGTTIAEGATAAGTALAEGATAVGQGALTAAEGAGQALGVVPESAAAAGEGALAGTQGLEVAQLMSSPMAQTMGMGEGAVFSGGAQVGQAGGLAAQASPEVAAAVTPGAGAGGFDWQGLAKKGMQRMMKGGQQQQQAQGGAGDYRAPVQNIPTPVGQLPFDPSYFSGAQLTTEELERLRKLRGGF